ncbi:MAG: hypothetical protein IIT60_07690, partial [Muribaculaceae bacterium]|nr:hypothetical protein [Muribaculaceae bacterium]
NAKRQGAEPRRAFQAANQVTFVPISIILHFLTEIFIKILAQQLRKRILGIIWMRMRFLTIPIIRRLLSVVRQPICLIHLIRRHNKNSDAK